MRGMLKSRPHTLGLRLIHSFVHLFIFDISVKMSVLCMQAVFTKRFVS